MKGKDSPTGTIFPYFLVVVCLVALGIVTLQREVEADHQRQVPRYDQYQYQPQYAVQPDQYQPQPQPHYHVQPVQPHFQPQSQFQPQLQPQFQSPFQQQPPFQPQLQLQPQLPQPQFQPQQPQFQPQFAPQAQGGSIVLPPTSELEKLRARYAKWMEPLQKGYLANTDNYPIPEVLLPLVHLILKQAELELTFFSIHPEAIAEFGDTTYLFSSEVPKMVGLGSVKYYFSHLAMYGEVTGRKVVLPNLPVSARSDQQQLAASIYDLHGTNANSQAKGLKLRFAESLPPLVQELANISYLLIDKARVIIHNWADSDFLSLLLQSQTFILKVPFWFCDKPVTSTMWLRMTALSVFRFTSVIEQQSRSLQALLQDYSRRVGGRGAYVAIHLRHEPQYDKFCKVYYAALGRNTSFCVDNKLGPENKFFLNVSTCYVETVEMVERLKLALVEGRLASSVIYLAGGYDVEEEETHRLFEGTPFRVFSKKNFLKNTPTSNDDLDFFWTALDYDVCRSASTFIGTGWSAFSMDIATERFLTRKYSAWATLDYNLLPLCKDNSPYCTYYCLAFWDHCEGLDKAALARAAKAMVPLISIQPQSQGHDDAVVENPPMPHKKEVH